MFVQPTRLHSITLIQLNVWRPFDSLIMYTLYVIIWINLSRYHNIGAYQWVYINIYRLIAEDDAGNQSCSKIVEVRPYDNGQRGTMIMFSVLFQRYILLVFIPSMSLISLPLTLTLEIAMIMQVQQPSNTQLVLYDNTFTGQHYFSTGALCLSLYVCL